MLVLKLILKLILQPSISVKDSFGFTLYLLPYDYLRDLKSVYMKFLLVVGQIMQTTCTHTVPTSHARCPKLSELSARWGSNKSRAVVIVFGTRIKPTSSRTVWSLEPPMRPLSLTRNIHVDRRLIYEWPCFDVGIRSAVGISFLVIDRAHPYFECCYAKIPQIKAIKNLPQPYVNNLISSLSLSGTWSCSVLYIMFTRSTLSKAT